VPEISGTTQICKAEHLGVFVFSAVGWLYYSLINYFSMKHFVTLTEKWEEDKYTDKTASTPMANGAFLTLASGYCLTATPGAALLGVCQEDVLASDVDYASTRKIAYQTSYNNYFIMDVTAGTATQAMVGSPFNVDTGGASLDVSAPGTQLEITKFISATKVEAKVILFA
jgi:hypothetical protein